MLFNFLNFFTHIFNLTVEPAIPTRTPTNEAKTEIQT